MQALNKWFFLLAAGALPASCPAAPEQEVTLEQKLAAKGFLLGEETRSIRNWSLSGWMYVDDYHFIIKSGPCDHYLISPKLNVDFVDEEAVLVVGIAIGFGF